MRGAGLLQRVRDFVELGKPRLSSLVVASTGAGFLMAGAVDYGLLAATCVGTALCATSANTFNQCWERSTDALMKRTQCRPLASNRLTLAQGIGYGVAAGAAGTGLLLATNPVVAGLGVANIALYSLVYTPLKRISALNTDVGSLVGAIPPVMGFVAAASAGHTLNDGLAVLMTPETGLLAAVLYAWQAPHFHALSWYSRKDYARGGHAMASVLDPSGERSAKLMAAYTGVLSALPVIAWQTGVADHMVLAAMLPNAVLAWNVAKFWREKTDTHARKVFHVSLWYLPAVLGCMVYSSTLRQQRDEAAHSKCTLKGVGQRDLCLHEVARDTGATPTCTEVVHAAVDVAETVAGSSGGSAAVAAPRSSSSGGAAAV